MTENKKNSPARAAEDKVLLEDTELENVSGGEVIQSNIPVTHAPQPCSVCGGGCRYEWVGSTEYIVCQKCGHRKAHASAGPSLNEPIPLRPSPQTQPVDGLPTTPVIPSMGE